MPKYSVTAPDGSVYEVNAPEGATEAQAIEYVQKNMGGMSATKPAAVKAGSALNDVGRQVGLTARYGIEGLANLGQIVTEPLRYLQDKVTPDRAPTMSQLVTGERTPKSLPLGMIGTQFADKLGLPSPQTANERVVADGTRMMVGGGGFAGAAQRGANLLTGGTQRVLSAMAANPASQVTASAGGGLAGGASREADGTSGQQILSTVLGTVAGGLTPVGINSVAQRIGAMRASPLQLEGRITVALQEQGIDFRALPRNIRDGLVSDLRRAMATGDEINPAALGRLADFRTTRTTPTRGTVTLDPVQITREKNLAKLGANSSNVQLQGLPRVQNENNATLIGNLNNLGAINGSIDDAGRLVTGAIAGRRDGLRAAENAAWDAARNSPGYRQPISSGVLSNINRALDDEGMMPFMSPQISRYMEAFQTGQRPFTPQDYRNLQSMLAREAAKGGNEGFAAGMAQRILAQADIAPPQPNGPAVTTAATAATMQADDAAGNAARNSLDAVNQARGATRAAYAYEDSSPLVRSVLSDGATADPKRIAQRFVIGGTTNEARTLAQEVGPQGVAPIKNALLAHLKSKALNGARDDVGNFSQSAFNKELEKIGVEKLRVFFTPEEIAQLQANGRVASYMQVQPAGSAVNNSNTGALLLGKGLDFLEMTPFLGPMMSPSLNRIGITLGERQMQNVGPSLLMPTPRQMAPGLLGPGVAAGGLLAAPGPNRP